MAERVRVWRSVMPSACWEEEDSPGWDMLVLPERVRVCRNVLCRVIVGKKRIARLGTCLFWHGVFVFIVV